MPTATKQKRQPFGKSSFNEGARSNLPAAPSRPGKENTSAPSPRRNSKTPKTSNLTTIGGAYGLDGDFLGINPTRKKKHAKSKQKLLDRRDAAKKRPDPSPLKKPDPTATTASSLSKEPKKKGGVKAFATSTLKSTRSDHVSKQGVKASSSVDVPIAMNPSTNDSLSSMDTANSTPEKDSPLITSPHGKQDPPTRSMVVEVTRKQSQKNVVAAQERLRHANDKPADKQDQREANHHQSAAPMAPSKKRGGADTNSTLAASASRKRDGVDNTNATANAIDAMMNSCKDGSEESRVVGSFVGGASLQRSHSDDVSEMTMMDDNVSLTSMTTLGGDNPSIADGNRKKSSSSHTIPSQLNLQRVDPINTRQANLIDEETIASHVTNRLKPGHQLQPIERDKNAQKTYLPAGWKECFSKTKKRPFWKHPDWGSTWYNPGLSVSLTDKQQSAQKIESIKANQPNPSVTANDHRTDDESMSRNSASRSTLDVTTKECNEDLMHQMNETDDTSAKSHHTANKPDPSPLQTKQLEPSAAFSASQASHQSKLTSSNKRRISEDYQKLLAPYQSVDKSVTSKAMSIASSRHSKASSSDDISSKCLTQEFDTMEEVGVGTPSIGNSVVESGDDNDSVAFDTTQDDHGGDEDDLMYDRKDADLNSLASDHVDVAALLSHRKNDSPMSTIRETVNEAVADASPSTSISSVDFGNDDGISHKDSDDEKSSVKHTVDGLNLSSDDEVNSQSSHETLSKSAIKDANVAGEEMSDDDNDQYDSDGGGKSPTFEGNFQDSDDDDTDDEVIVSQHQSKQKSTKLRFAETRESTAGTNEFKKRKFFPLDLCAPFSSLMRLKKTSLTLLCGEE